MQTQIGTRVLMLGWSPASAHRSNEDLRNAIAVALQGDRTLDSVVPGGIPDHISAFPLGGSAKPDITWSNRIQLTLGYDPTMPDGQDIATQIRTRLEDTGGMSVRLRAVDPTADTDNPPDLMVLDRKAWTSTRLAWMQPYLDAPLPKRHRGVAGWSASTGCGHRRGGRGDAGDGESAAQGGQRPRAAAADPVRRVRAHRTHGRRCRPTRSDRGGSWGCGG